jgi:hypothetical protein
MEFQRSMGRVTRPGLPTKLRIESVIDNLQESGGKKTEGARILGVGRAKRYRFLRTHPELLDEE